jgi:hypothetical protein
LLPAAAAFLVRLFVQEPERWKSLQVHSRVRVREIFAPALRRFTYSGMFTAVVALISWWSCSAFIPVIATGLAHTSAERSGLGAAATQGLIEHWKVIGTMAFNIGGLVGTLLTIPIAKRLGRRPMFGLYFGASAVALLTTFGLDMPAQTRLAMFFVIGVPVFGIFGSFPYYLPELFPTRVRATGAGFCYNIGRVLASVGPFLVGAAAAHNTAMQSIFYVGFVPLVALLFVPWIIETRGQPLSD